MKISIRLCAVLSIASALLSYTGSASAGPGGSTVTEKHLGFDACQNISTTTMQNGWNGTSYGVAGFYIGGRTVDYVCPAHSSYHDATWVNAVYAQGWNFQLIWSGYQSPCVTARYQHSTDPATAYSQGLSEASAAAAAAGARGFAQGSAIVLDLEGSITTSCPYLAATLQYVQGWVVGLYFYGSSGYWPGVYSGTCTFPNVASMTWVPDHISIAQWNNLPGVYQVSSCLSAGSWSFNQRSHQYRAAHSETWGGVAVSIDSSCYDERVAGAHVHSVNTSCLN